MLVTTLLACGVTALDAQATDSTVTRLRGFVDTYYAYDVNRPPDGERRFTTQPARHDEVNVNLAWLGISVERARSRARVALQAGTSVQSNYSAEPRNGATSGPDVSRFIQEAVVGVRVANRVWIDGGVYYSYIGQESWSSSENLTYTRSLVAEYSPYYLSGVRLSWQATGKLAAQVHVTNGCQNISENNRSKAVGLRLDYAIAPTLTLSYANFLGNEQPADNRPVLRVFNQLMAKGTLPSKTEWQGQLDVGRQGGASWYGLVAIARQPVTSRVAVVGRVERYADPDQVIISSAGARGFVGNGVSAGIDVTIEGGVHWRTELRGIRVTEPLYAKGAGGQPTRINGVAVSSLSIGF